MIIKRLPFYTIVFGLIFLTVLEVINPTFYEIRNTHAKLTNTEHDSNTFDLNVAVYILVIPLIMNTVIVCILGKYSHETSRSMVKCYICIIHLSVMSYITNINITNLINLFFIHSFFITNCIQITSTILLILINSFNILVIEIIELKRIYNTKEIEISLLIANRRGFYLLLVYAGAYIFSLVYLFNKIKLFLAVNIFMYVIGLTVGLAVINSFVMAVWYRKRTNMS